jgi:hypothetical protein
VKSHSVAVVKVCSAIQWSDGKPSSNRDRMPPIAVNRGNQDKTRSSGGLGSPGQVLSNGGKLVLQGRSLSSVGSPKLALGGHLQISNPRLHRLRVVKQSRHHLYQRDANNLESALLPRREY